MVYGLELTWTLQCSSSLGLAGFLGEDSSEDYQKVLHWRV